MKSFAAKLSLVALVSFGCASDPASSDSNPGKTNGNTDDKPTGGDDGTTVDGPDGSAIEVTFTGEGVECGDERCKDATVVGFNVGAQGCCANEATSTCGLDMSVLGFLLGIMKPGCEPLDKPGSKDDSCSASDPIAVALPDAPPDGVTLAGCCQENGKCGYSADFGNFGFGCVAPERFGQKSSGSCTYKP